MAQKKHRIFIPQIKFFFKFLYTNFWKINQKSKQLSPEYIKKWTVKMIDFNLITTEIGTKKS